jgi:hypothetical protein
MTAKKKGVVKAPPISEPISENIQFVIDDTAAANSLKKRGRKPKGGKIMSKQLDNSGTGEVLPNVILHLKCSTTDLIEYNTHLTKLLTDPHEYNPSVPPTVVTYNNEKNTFFSYETSIEQVPQLDYAYAGEPAVFNNNTCSNCCSIKNETVEEDEDINISMKDVNSKLKKLKINLYKNANSEKKSACFWCTYDFDNPPCYIPKYEMDNTLYGYGSFCRPECAVAFLMRESLDDSTKFERYHLLNQIYSKIYDFKKNIKPAPNPYYLLSKFYGTLSIQEYRKLLKTEHMLLVVDKPMTRILPELHEDNDEFMLNIYGGTKSVASQQGTYKVKKQSEKPQSTSKNSIMRDKFGMV